MARQILPISGQIIGGMIGGPVGAAIGGAIGSAVGQYVDPIRHQGPKLGEARAQTAQEGVYRPLVFGTGCVAGNVIHRSPRKVVRHRESVGKGNRDTVDTDRGYRTFAIRICEGPVAGLLRIWENETLVYDVRPESEITQESAEYAERFRFYSGTEDQLPDPDLEAYLGVGNVNSYRGSCYIVFGNFDLTDYGDMVPQYRFEVVGQGGELSIGISAAGPHLLPDHTVSEGPTMAADVSDGIYLLTGGKGLDPSEAGNWSGFWPDVGETYQVTRYNPDFSNPVPHNITNTGLPVSSDERIWPHAITADGYAAVRGGNFYGLAIFKNGSFQYAAIPYPGWPDTNWFYSPSWYSGYDGNGSCWIVGDSVYYGLRQFNAEPPNRQALANRIYRWPLDGTGVVAAENVLQVLPWTESGGPLFRFSVSRQQNVYVLRYGDKTLTRYNSALGSPTQLPVPAHLSDNFASIRNVGVDEAAGMMCFAYLAPGVNTERLHICDMSGAQMVDIELIGFAVNVNTKILFTGSHIYIQRGNRFFRVSYSFGGTITIGQIVEWSHRRVGQSEAEFDTGELVDVVDGVVFADGYTARDAITTLIPIYNADASEHDRGSGYRINYIKRGAPVVRTLTGDDLVDEPEETVREDPMERPRVLHMAFESPITGYTAGKASIQRISPDVKLVNEVSTYVPVTFKDVDEAWQKADVQMRVAWTEVHGERKFSIPDSHIDLVPTDNVALSLRGQVQRLRLLKNEYADGVLKLESVADRQSNYTSHVTGIPLPAPEKPPPSIMGPTDFAVLDIPALSDNDDRLLYYVAASGMTDAWAGAAVQRQRNDGWITVANFTPANRTVMGVLESEVASGSQHYTDTTNEVVVRLHIQSDELHSLTDQQFLSAGGAFALETAAGWEILLYRDAEQLDERTYRLTHLARGRLNTPADAHAVGAKFVLLDRVQAVDATMAMLYEEMTHRAVSVGRSPEGVPTVTTTFMGMSQAEWKPAHLLIFENEAGNGWRTQVIPRHRFGTEENPIPSINLSSYAWTAVSSEINVGANRVGDDQWTFSTNSPARPITVTVEPRNRYTWQTAPSLSKDIL